MINSVRGGKTDRMTGGEGGGERSPDLHFIDDTQSCWTKGKVITAAS